MKNVKHSFFLFFLLALIMPSSLYAAESYHWQILRSINNFVQTYINNPLKNGASVIGVLWFMATGNLITKEELEEIKAQAKEEIDNDERNLLGAFEKTREKQKSQQKAVQELAVNLQQNIESNAETTRILEKHEQSQCEEHAQLESKAGSISKEVGTLQGSTQENIEKLRRSIRRRKKQEEAVNNMQESDDCGYAIHNPTIKADSTIRSAIKSK
jgi:citrate synthase